ncbi:DMT family transporter [Paraglaciecola polaris]|uniref:Membrane protein n=1 Tax=Paraglaciecola polaris LMG 21857 TaxID=1129793 RepID=K7AFS7_9ALTE|nr:DMT family transporter [Paraglaciecola polaris]GAC34150.1 membrane protein [Paraglaciecola polaris LMG 21857]|tara:strand:+ start:12868 stop:13794 length:927 start_codon:yes stop_codon:yes gene_type:complete
MRSAVLYVVTVLIWGSTWLAIEFQLGDVAAQVSLVYRFGIAAILMWAYCLFRRMDMQFPWSDHGFFILLAVCNFGLNYLILYWAQNYLTSAMASIAFSTLLLMNIINTRLFFGRAIAKRIYVGAGLGVIGLGALFWHDIKDLDFASDAMLGLGLALGGTFIASLGNMASVRNSARKIGVMQGNAWGMLYGTLALTAVVLLSDAQFSFSTKPSYVLSLLYLSLFGTVIAFACYFLLLRDIGPEKASYSIVLFPVVAVVLSTFYEGFVWHNNTVLGFVLVIVGNAIVLTPMAKIRHWLALRKLQRGSHSR